MSMAEVNDRTSPLHTRYRNRKKVIHRAISMSYSSTEVILSKANYKVVLESFFSSRIYLMAACKIFILHFQNDLSFEGPA